MSANLDIMGPLLVAAIAALPGILAFSVSRRRQLADRQDNLTERWRDFYEPMQREIDKLRQRVVALEASLEECEKEKNRIMLYLGSMMQKVGEE